MADLHATGDPDLYSRVLRRGWPLLLALTAIGLLAGGLLLTQLPRTYAATSSILVTTTGAAETSAVGSRTVGGSVNLDTEAQLITSADVIDGALTRLDRMGASIDPSTVAQQVSVSVPANTTVLQIRFTAGTPELARRGAEAFAAAYLASRSQQAQDSLDAEASSLRAQLDSSQNEQQRLQRTIARGGQTGGAEARLQSAVATSVALAEALVSLESTVVTPGRVINEPQLPRSAASPQVLPVVGSGGALGLLVGLALAVHTQRVRPRLLDEEDVRRELRIPVLAQVPRDRSMVVGTPAHPRSDQGLAAAQLARRLGDPASRMILVVPVSSNDSAVQVAWNTAWRRARTGVAARMVTEHGPVPLDVELHESDRWPGLWAGEHHGTGTTAVSAELGVFDLGGDPENIRGLPPDSTLTFVACGTDSGLLHLAHRGVPCVLVATMGVDRAPRARRTLRQLEELGAEVAGMVLQAPVRSRPASWGQHRLSRAARSAGSSSETGTARGSDLGDDLDTELEAAPGEDTPDHGHPSPGGTAVPLGAVLGARRWPHRPPIELGRLPGQLQQREGWDPARARRGLGPSGTDAQDTSVCGP